MPLLTSAERLSEACELHDRYSEHTATICLMTLAPERVLVMPQNAVISGHITCSNVHAMCIQCSSFTWQ